MIQFSRFQFPHFAHYVCVWRYNKIFFFWPVLHRQTKGYYLLCWMVKSKLFSFSWVLTIIFVFGNWKFFFLSFAFVPKNFFQYLIIRSIRARIEYYQHFENKIVCPPFEISFINNGSSSNGVCHHHHIRCQCDGWKVPHFYHPPNYEKRQQPSSMNVMKNFWSKEWLNRQSQWEKKREKKRNRTGPISWSLVT